VFIAAFSPGRVSRAYRDGAALYRLYRRDVRGMASAVRRAYAIEAWVSDALVLPAASSC
jgi:hypothetical protein